MLENPIEGCFVVTSDDLIFEVKGIVHPRNRIIAYVRYVPDATAERRGYRKIYNLEDRENYLRTHFPHYLWYSKEHGRILQSIPQDRIKLFLNPVECLMHMRREQSDSSGLAASTVRLSDKLIEITGIEEMNIGVTGSQLAELATETSDIDLVVYGTAVCQKFYSHIKKSFNLIPELCCYSGDLLNSHTDFRWGQLNQYHSILRTIERGKFLQGVFEGYQFFIRLVKLPSDINQRYGTIITRMREICEVQCIVKDISDSIFTPCEYRVKSERYPKLQKLISYRGRFTEQILSEGFVNVRGRLEDVINTQTNESYQQIVLGESSTDFLIPI